MNNSFVHLHLHSEYSISDSLIRIKDLLRNSSEKEFPAIAITDANNLFSLVKFYKTAIKNGIKPIIGIEVDLKNENNHEKVSRVVLLCKNMKGFNNLSNLITDSYINLNEDNKFTITREQLAERSEGLIALSGGINGELGNAIKLDRKDLIDDSINFWKKNFNNSFYIEISRTGKDFEEEYLSYAMELAEKHELPLVATNDVRFINKEDFQAHEVRVCINNGTYLKDEKRRSDYNENQYLKSSKEMIDLFSDIPSAIENSLEIAKRCNIHLPLGEIAMPIFPLDDGQDENEYFKSLVNQSLNKKFSDKNILNKEPYYNRLKIELDVILSMGYAGYFLIVSDFVMWAKKNNIPVGPGRGSGAGSLVAYVLDITNIDPIKYDLLFERFLNPERVSLPDFDIDFCMDKRDHVIDYVAKKYGRNKVSQIITYGTMAAKAVVRDVGRVLQYPYAFVDQVAKLIPFEIGITLSKALEDQELKKLYDSDDDVKEIVDMAKILEGLPRNAGTHAGGIVISPTDLINFTPLYRDNSSSSMLTQLDKDDVEEIGLIKFDFLGLRTLTVIQNTIKIINRNNHDKDIFILDNIPLNDEATFHLLRQQKTNGVFQLESRGLKDIIKRLKPDKFDDLVALVALYRPGPLQSGMVDDFIDRKNGANVQYLHPLIEDVLKPTYGVILYQEQVMKIAQVLAGYSLGAADILRRAMGKKKFEEMKQQRRIFVEGAIKNNVDKAQAEYIFDLMEKFAGYGFNKSHSVAYALIAYQTAFLKTHYKEPFIAAVLSSDMDNTDKVVRFVKECEYMSINLTPPNINKSNYTFTVTEKNEIVYGLGAIKGVGKAIIDIILNERSLNGSYKSLDDLLKRCGTNKINKRVIEALIKSGSFDTFGDTRSSLMSIYPKSMKMADQNSKNIQHGQIDIFGFTESNEKKKDLEPSFEWPTIKKLSYERDVLGFYLSGHPINEYKNELKNIVSNNLYSIKKNYSKNGPQKNNIYKIAGVINNIRIRTTSTKDKLAQINLGDDTDNIDVIANNNLLDNSINRDEIVIIEGTIRFDEYTNRLSFRAKSIDSLDHARIKYATGLKIKVTNESDLSVLTEKLEVFFKDNKESGKCLVRIDYVSSNIAKSLVLGEKYKILPTNDIITQLENLDCVQDIQLIYSKM
ncbi:MAG: DNA polymerase III subunit alpha [Gammaproteobacteria bacterium]